MGISKIIFCLLFPIIIYISSGIFDGKKSIRKKQACFTLARKRFREQATPRSRREAVSRSWSVGLESGLPAGLASDPPSRRLSSLSRWFVILAVRFGGWGIQVSGTQ